MLPLLVLMGRKRTEVDGMLRTFAEVTVVVLKRFAKVIEGRLNGLGEVAVDTLTVLAEETEGVFSEAAGVGEDVLRTPVDAMLRTPSGHVEAIVGILRMLPDVAVEMLRSLMVLTGSVGVVEMPIGMLGRLVELTVWALGRPAAVLVGSTSFVFIGHDRQRGMITKREKGSPV